jgi:O-antigen ligase
MGHPGAAPNTKAARVTRAWRCIKGHWVTIDTNSTLLERNFRRERFVVLADGLAAAVAIALPWSTTLTVSLIWLYLLALAPTLKVAAFGRECLQPVSALPTALFMLAVTGMLWADVPVGERFAGLSSFRLILIIPALIFHFRHSANAHWVLVGFLVSCTALLALSWALFLFPGIPWHRPPVRGLGVPVRDPVAQSAEFTVCIFALMAVASGAWRAGRRWYAISLIALAFTFFANMLYVSTSRTALIVFPILLVLFGLREFGRRGALALLIVGASLTAAAWVSSPYLRMRVTNIVTNIEDYHSNVDTPVGQRLEFWRKSIDQIAEAPLIGHGTGTIPSLFRRGATAETPPELITKNPHSQILTVALQLGLVGAIVLLAMWFVHLTLFIRPGLPAWIGLIVVVQNVISSLFNSHLFDFTQGIGYGLGVGVAGALILRDESTRPAARSEPVKQ